MLSANDGDYVVPGELMEIAENVRSGKVVPAIPVRELLWYFRNERRGVKVVQAIRRVLDKVGLRTEPDFENIYIDGEIQFVSTRAGAPQEGTQPSRAESENRTFEDPRDNLGSSSTARNSSGNDTSPTFCVGSLKAGNKGVVSTAPDAPLLEATTKMLQHDYSQLPVITGQVTVKGVISWSSIGSRRVMQAPEGSTVRDYMDENWEEVRADQPVFEVLPRIAERGYALVRGSNNAIVGIVTPADLSLKFQEATEPYLLCNEIEENLRYFAGRLSFEEDIRPTIRADGDSREIFDINFLTWSQLAGCLGKENNWRKLEFKGIDRAVFIHHLNEITKIRNRIMHFRLADDPVTEDNLRPLQATVKFLRLLRRLNNT